MPFKNFRVTFRAIGSSQASITFSSVSSWIDTTYVTPGALRARKIENIRRAVEEGLNDANWANTRLRGLGKKQEAKRAHFPGWT